MVLNNKVQLRATVSARGVLADEKRRVAAPRFAEARKPPTGESAASGGPTNLAATRATLCPRKPTATTRKIAVSSDVAAAVSGVLVVAETVNSGTAPASASSPPDDAPGSQQPWLDRGVDERERRWCPGDPEVVSHMLGRRRVRGPLEELTPREHEVLRLMAEGRSNHAIADALVISGRAVEKHVTSIFTKLNLPPAPEDHRRVLAVLAFLRN